MFNILIFPDGVGWAKSPLCLTIVNSLLPTRVLALRSLLTCRGARGGGECVDHLGHHWHSRLRCHPARHHHGVWGWGRYHDHRCRRRRCHEYYVSGPHWDLVLGAWFVFRPAMMCGAESCKNEVVRWGFMCCPFCLEVFKAWGDKDVIGSPAAN